jgi:hypothetical protein
VERGAPEANSPNKAAFSVCASSVLSGELVKTESLKGLAKSVGVKAQTTIEF